MFDVDVCIIGGGILGCMAARNLTRFSLKVLLIEKENDVCTGISRANTAIVYPGYDNKPGTLKSRLCVKANANFSALCEELGVEVSRCGSLMVCHGPRGAEVLKKKYANGQESHVPGLELLTGEEIHALEPHLSDNLYMGLYCPNTATIQPWELGIAAYENAVANGCAVLLNTKVTGIEQYSGGFRITISEVSHASDNVSAAKSSASGGFSTVNASVSGDSPTESSSQVVLTTRAILNCAGLYADRIREMLFPPFVRIYPEKADYFILNLHGREIGDHAVIIGSGDIGMILARRLSLHGKKVLCMTEIQEKSPALPRNRRNCQEAFGIPLLLHTELVEIHGYPHIEAVTLRDIPTNTCRKVECSLLIVAAGLLPDRTLLENFLPPLWERTSTEEPDPGALPTWLHLCGNCHHVHPIVDGVSLEAKRLALQITLP